MLSLNFEGYTKQQVIDVLHSKYAARNISFRYDLLDKNDVFKKTLNNVQSGEVSMASLAQIKRTAKFHIYDDDTINWLSDRIQPFCLFKMPDGKHIEFPLGIFLLSSPIRKESGVMLKETDYTWSDFGKQTWSDLGGLTWEQLQEQKISTRNSVREVEAFDGLVVLIDDKFDSRYVIKEGTNYKQEVIRILNSAGITKVNIEDTDSVLTKSIEFEPGKEKLYAINELLRQINFNQLYVDVNGYYTSTSYKSPTTRAADYTYVDDELSVTYSGLTEELDIYNVPNKWVVVRTNAEQEPIISTYINNNPQNPTSTVNRGRTIVDYRELDDVANQESLDAYVQRIAQEASQIYGKIVFETAIMPFHDFANVLDISYSPLAIDGKYSETSWSFQLKAGAKMKHECRRVVTL